MKKLFFLILIALMASISYSQTSSLSSAGTDFKFVFLQNRTMPDGDAPHSVLPEVSLFIYISNTSQTDNNIITISSNTSQSFSYKVTISDNNTPDIYPGPTASFSIPAGEEATVQIITDVTVYSCDANIMDMRGFQMMGNNTIQKKEFKINSRLPITVYAESSQPHSRDASLILPTKMLGKDYYIVNYKPDPIEYPFCYNGTEQFGGPSEFAILAFQDNTEITITFPSNINQLQTNMSSNIVTPNSNHQYTITLNQGESIQFQSDDYELTGTHIESNNAIAVFAGNMAVGLPFSTRTFDHLYEEMFPTGSWGFRYITTPLVTELNNNQLTDIYKIISSQSGNKIKINGTILKSNGNDIILNQGDFLEFINNQVYKNGDYNNPLPNVTPAFNQSAPNLIEAVSSPIQLVLFSASAGIEGTNDSQEHLDPFMIILTPLEKPITEATISIPQELNYTMLSPCSVCNPVKKDYITVVAKTSEADMIKIDDLNGNVYTVSNLPTSGQIPALEVNWVPISGTDYSYAVINVSNNNVDNDNYCTNNITSSPVLYKIYEDDSISSGFNAYIYGYNCRESYGYSAGIGMEISSNNILSNEDFYIKVTPNPVKETLRIRFSLPDKVNYLVIRNVLGEKVIEKEISHKEGVETLNVKQLEKGIYFISINNNKGIIETQKIIKL